MGSDLSPLIFTPQHGSSRESSCGAFAFSLRKRNRQKKGETSNRNGNDAITVVGDGEERHPGGVLVDNNHHERRIDDDNGHTLIMNGSPKVNEILHGRHHSDSGEHEIKYNLGDMNGDGHRHQQQEQQNQQQQVGQQNLLTRNMDMVAEEPFHDTSVYATDPQENVNSKPSTLISTAH